MFLLPFSHVNIVKQSLPLTSMQIYLPQCKCYKVSDTFVPAHLEPELMWQRQCYWSNEVLVLSFISSPAYSLLFVYFTICGLCLISARAQTLVRSSRMFCSFCVHMTSWSAGLPSVTVTLTRCGECRNPAVCLCVSVYTLFTQHQHVRQTLTLYIPLHTSDKPAVFVLSFIITDKTFCTVFLTLPCVLLHPRVSLFTHSHVISTLYALFVDHF